VSLSNLNDQGKVRIPVARHGTGQLVRYLLCLAGSFIMLFPLAWLVRSSIMSPGQIFAFPPEWIPNPLAWENYPEALTTIPFLLYFQNTLLILVPTVLGTVITATLAAYGFSRLRWRGRDLVLISF
jgi:multiple sugar transport system permease protein